MKKYVITAAQAGAKVNSKAFNSYLNYCKKNNAELIIIPMTGAVANKIYYFDDRLLPYLTEPNEIRDLSPKIRINSIKISPTQQRPLTSLKRLVHKTTIFGATKLQMECIATSNYKLPKIMVSTGAITDPFYSNTKAGLIALKDHKFGAIVVEVVNDDIFHFRPLTCNGNGEIIDLGVRYSGNRVKKEGAKVLVLGDVHVGSECPKTMKATDEMIKYLNPEEIIYHDIMDSYSVNHHHENNLVLNTLKAEAGLNSLLKEYKKVAAFLLSHKKSYKNVKQVIVASNHDEAIERYIKEGRFISDPINARIANKLFGYMLDGFLPLEAFIKFESEHKHELKEVKFLTRDDDYKVAGIQLASHGDLGANGAKASPISQDLGAGDSIIGHSHTPKILYGVYQVGTSTVLKLEYNRGLSSWMNCHCILNKDGSRQLINIIDGLWKAK